MCTLADSLHVFWSIWRPCLRQRVYYTITVTSTYKTTCWATERRCCAGIECCSLEVAVLLLALLPLTHLQVSPSLKQVWGFHPGRQAERLVQWGRTAMFFPNNRVSTRAVNWKTKPPKNNSETQTEGGEYFSVYSEVMPLHLDSLAQRKAFHRAWLWIAALDLTFPCRRFRAVMCSGRPGGTDSLWLSGREAAAALWLMSFVKEPNMHSDKEV